MGFSLQDVPPAEGRAHAPEPAMPHTLLLDTSLQDYEATLALATNKSNNTAVETFPAKQD